MRPPRYAAWSYQRRQQLPQAQARRRRAGMRCGRRRQASRCWRRHPCCYCCQRHPCRYCCQRHPCRFCCQRHPCCFCCQRRLLVQQSVCKRSQHSQRVQQQGVVRHSLLPLVTLWRQPLTPGRQSMRSQWKQSRRLLLSWQDWLRRCSIRSHRRLRLRRLQRTYRALAHC